jgi:hypothetical protein
MVSHRPSHSLTVCLALGACGLGILALTIPLHHSMRFRDEQAQRAANREFAIVTMNFTASMTSVTLSCNPPTYLLAYLQVEESGESSGTNAASDVVNCMRARKNAREFSYNFSWAVALVLAIVIYLLMMLLFARRLPSSWKWFMSPFLGCLLVASVAAYYENYQLTHYCGEESIWRVNTLSQVFLINLVIVLAIFSAWLAINYFRKINRLKRLKNA